MMMKIFSFRLLAKMSILKSTQGERTLSLNCNKKYLKVEVPQRSIRFKFTIQKRKRSFQLVTPKVNIIMVNSNIWLSPVR